MTIPFERLKARLLANPTVKAEYDARSAPCTSILANRPFSADSQVRSSNVDCAT